MTMQTSSPTPDATRSDATTRDMADSALVKDNVTATTENAADTPASVRPPATLFGYALPAAISNKLHTIQSGLRGWQISAAKSLPGAVVNNSSNIIGFLQIAADMAMWKSNGFSLLTIEKKVDDKQVFQHASLNNPLTYIYYPIRNVFTSIFSKARGNITLKDFIRPNFYKQSFKDFINLESAALHDSAGGTRKLVNTWNARSGFACIATMTFAALLPETKQTREETEAEVIQSKQRPLTYIATQLGRALWFLPNTAIQLVQKTIHPNEKQQIGKYKHQFVGLGFILGGIFSMMSGFRQIQGDVIGKQRYIRSTPQMGVGFFTTVAGCLTMTGADADQGWKGFGMGMILRNIFLPFNIFERFNKMVQGRAWYALGQGIFQSKNVFAFLVGGSEKKLDGTIVDNKEIRQKALNEVKRYKLKSLGWDADYAPSTSIAAGTVETSAKGISEEQLEKPEGLPADKKSDAHKAGDAALTTAMAR